MKILVTTSSFGKYDKTPLKRLRLAGFEIVMNPYGHTLSREEALEFYKEDIDGVIAGIEDISSEIISKAGKLKVISRCGIGLDNIDMGAARDRAIDVFNTPAAVADAVAELALGLILSCLRNITRADNGIRHNNWEKPMGLLLTGKTLGIIGLGRAGKSLIRLTSSFNLKVLAYDIKRDNDFAKKFGVDYTDLDSLLSRADVVSVHLPLTEKTKSLLGSDRLNSMKPGAFLINTSRAAVIDEAALVDALKRGKIAGAALDVFEKEPYSGPLAGLENVVLTPHIGSYAKEARVRMEIEAAENLIKGLKVETEARR